MPGIFFIIASNDVMDDLPHEIREDEKSMTIYWKTSVCLWQWNQNRPNQETYVNAIDVMIGIRFGL